MLADLLKQTFIHQWNFVLNETESTSEILKKFSGFKISDFVCACEYLVFCNSFVYSIYCVHAYA